MLYLFLAILCSSSIALIFKYSEGNNLNRYAVTSTNYFTAFLVSFIMILREKINPFDYELSWINFGQDFKAVLLSDSIHKLNANSSFMWAILAGVIAGLFFFLSFIYYQKSVRENGVGLSGTFGKMGILIPMIFSILLWNEIPTLIQWIGIALSLVSILIVNFSFKRTSLQDVNLTLILLFIFGGMAEFSNKIFEKYALLDFKNVFLFFIFFTAFWISLAATLKRKKRVKLQDLWIGFMVGIPNLFSSFFLILALNTIPASVAFPIYSASSIVLINLGGFLLFKEKLSRKETFSVIITIFALILINL